MQSRNDVSDFMVAAKQTIYTKPGFNEHNKKQAELYLELVKEEFKELLDGFELKDIVEVADACADLKWVIEGLEHSLGIPQQKVWDEVNASNLSKTVDGKLLLREDGKVLKPDSYFPPNIKRIIDEA